MLLTWEVGCMNYISKYSYEDYEEAYCHLQYHKCKEIGVYILSKQKDKYSKKLLKKLKKFECDLLCQDTKNDKLL